MNNMQVKQKEDMMNYYNKNSETTRITEYKKFKVIMVSQEYCDCKKEVVENISMSIKKLIASTGIVLERVISADVVDKIQEQYKYCLKHTIAIGVDDVDKLIEKYKVTDDEEIKLLKEEVINLLDDVDALFNQG